MAMIAATSGCLLTVRSVRIETDDARTFELDVPMQQRSAYQGCAGQFVRVTIPGDGPQLSRCYSLSSTPELGEPLRFTVKRIDGGRVSDRLVSRIAPGALLHVEPPVGFFTLAKSDGPLLLIAGGSGITPVFSLLKAALYTTDRIVALLYANRNRASAIFAADIDDLARIFAPRFRVEHHFSDECGFPTSEDLHRFVDAYEGADVYVCGPEPLMAMAEALFTNEGPLAGYKLICERFGPLVVDTAANPDTKEQTAGARPGSAQIMIEIDGVAHACTWRGDGTVLDAAITAGVPMPYSCREGHCGACKARLVSGEVTQGLVLALSKRDRERNYVLPCCATPASSSICLEYV